MTEHIPVTPDTVATLRQLLLDRCTAVGDTPPAIRSRRAPEDLPPFVLLVEAGEVRARHAPVLTPASVSLAVFDVSPQAAVRRYRRLAAIVHGQYPSVVELEAEDGGRVAVWKVFDETGPQGPVQEPDSGWWRVSGVFDLFMADRPLGG